LTTKDRGDNATTEKKRILVVDDEESIRTTIAEILQLEGYEVDTASTGAEAIQKSNEKYYDLAVSDMRLPDMLGYQVLAGMHESVPKMVKIIVTGYPSVQNAISAINEGGVDGYLLKPVDAELLLNEIKNQIQRREESRKFSQTKVAEFLMTRARELGLQVNMPETTTKEESENSGSSNSDDLEKPWEG